MRSGDALRHFAHPADGIAFQPRACPPMQPQEACYCGIDFHSPCCPLPTCPCHGAGRDLHSALQLTVAGSQQRLFAWERRGKRVALEIAKVSCVLARQGRLPASFAPECALPPLPKRCVDAVSHPPLRPFALVFRRP